VIKINEMASAWINHVKSYQRAHPNKTYGECMTLARPSYKKQSGGNPAMIAQAVGKVSDTVGQLAGVAGDVTGQIMDNVQHRRDESGFYKSEGRDRALKKYNELRWRRKHGIARWRTDPSLTDRDLKHISGLSRYQ
jgi:hypothetical protein